MFGLPEHFGADALVLVLFGFLAAGVMILGTLGFDWAWRKVDIQAEVQKGNVAAAIVMASVIIGMSVVMAFTVKAVVG